MSQTATTTDTPGSRVVLPLADGDAFVAFMVVSGAMVVAGGVVAAINGAAPFSHGSWLAAYLVLVGGVAQALLGVGRIGLPGRRHDPRLARAELWLWNLGNAAVVGGTLGNTSGAVAAGSIALLAALGAFAVGMGAVGSVDRARTSSYIALVALLACSVAVGCVFAFAGSPGPG